ncbi:monocarboxylate transporter 9-like [Ruditapes philippinarum]|uniref:monocarboxylate transporter 9-like n=1 Tax=Ruditapes philippinarum TaxID=129788 RepID=UPI00295B21C9|nr:monocarboxylate transporter 9-like [Ruditapes philippinarum]XP_060597327.1 monocarboxylate transporter 9-like [Ruditapes philippinarum]XP_060597328.1 monocarboxylate transporter 9-like [Ruditapes philippinarum]XP_060597329.1 monocarboxylate transporter 9-like [Ruditapes philippinarum]
MAEFPDLDSTWSWIVMVAIFVALSVIGGTNYTVGLVHNILLEKYNETQTTTAWVGAVHTSISNLAAPLSSALIDHFSVRTAMMTGGLLYTIGFLSTAFAPNISLSVLTFGVIAGLGGASGWTASMIAPNSIFKKYRNIAQGISFSV